MKQKLLFTLLAVLLFFSSGAWAAVTYSGTALTTTTHKVESDTKTFLDLTEETTNAQIKNGASTFALGLHYVISQSWATGSGANSTTSSTAATDNGFLANYSNSSYDAYTQAYGNVQIKSNQQTVIYVTGITSLAIFGKDNNTSENKQLIIKVAEIAENGTVGTEYSTTSTASISDHVTAYSGSTLSGTAFYRITLTTGSTSACNTYQIRFTPYVNPNPTFSLTKSTIGIDETSQIRVGKKSGLDGITLNSPTSSNTVVATVSETGLITPHKAGTADITFTSNAVTGKYNAVAETQTLTVTVKEMLSVSAYLSATANTPTTTNCAFKYYGSEGSLGSVPAGTSYKEGEYYHSKMNNDANYYEITPTTGAFQAGDVITVYIYSNGTTIGYKLASNGTAIELTGQTKSLVIPVPHTLTAAEIQENGTVRIYRDGSNTYFAGVTIRGEREPSLTISAQPESAAYATGASATALSVTALPYYDGGTLTYQWYSNTTENTEGAVAIPSATSSTYMPSTESAGTTYYYCVVTEAAISCSVTTDIVSVLVSSQNTINVSIADGQTTWGTVDPAGETQALGGTSFEITATPNTGYKFVKWVIDGEAVTTNPYTFSNISASHTAVAHFAARKSISYNVTDGSKGTTLTGLETEYANDEDKFTAPVNYYISKDGNTLTSWTDGTNTYIPGTEYTLTENITLQPVFTANNPTLAAALDASSSETEISWSFDYVGGNAPAISIENRTGYYVKQATVGGKSYDFVMAIDNTTGSAIAGVYGKTVNNYDKATQSDRTYAQVNRGAKWTIPAVKGMTIVAYSANGNYLAADDKSDADESKWKYATTVGGVVATSGTGTRTATWVYNGEASTIDYVAGNDAGYVNKLVVTYPVQPLNTVNISSETITPTGVSSGTVSYTSDNGLNAVTVKGSGSKFEMETVDAVSRFKVRGGNLTIATSSETKCLKRIVFHFLEGDNQHPLSDAAFTLASDEEGSASCTTPWYTATWTDNAEIKTIKSVKFAFSENSSKSMYITSIDLTYWDTEGTKTESVVLSYGWATYITPDNVEFEDGDAFVVTEVNSSTGATTLAAVETAPANTPVLLRGEGTKTITILDSDQSDPASTLLSICDGTSVDGKYPYVLAKNGDSAGFKKWTGDISLLNNRVVMWLDSEVAAAQSFFILDSGDEMTTGVSFNVNENVNSNAPIYNLAGQKVSESYKGIVIKNGRKYFNK